ncbi:carbon storage regulator CsrA [Sporomusa sphaeroides]|uniref:Translational regulator CsrA n=1 Tax=Sporomusa sphaeroides DSM 2875 TaxID=1337886 RepID=A0ABP2C671_9FIRM|nr:carbon storage regulator CsrA [Sporomusa sphaeroides]OLS55567.1 carbon storage regulator [Sporomusa sphaeroides DSM 2875]CVK19896.1 Carbon storage regulator [Sporomusa sphaeroides DSM 2875]
MLALTRKVGERIVIDNNIILTIVDIKGDSIRLAIDAPKEVRIYRGELYDAIVAENRQSASPAVLPGSDILQKIKLP